MGLHDGFMVNITSFAESSKNLVFPSQSSILKEIPLFLKFTCVEYSMNSIARAGTTMKLGTGGNVKAYISVPVPSKMVTQTAMRYKQDENELYSKAAAQTKLEEVIKTRTKGLLLTAADFLNTPEWLKTVLGDAANRTARSFSQLIETDFTETILQSGSKRSFVISLYLPCLNVEDSKKAAEISRAFEALALPTMMKVGVPGSIGLGAQLHFHPPMWFFNIGPLGGAGDVDWTSQPQASVLTNVAVTKTAIDTTSFTALDLTIKPIAYSITLNFQEIETAFRETSPTSGTGFEIKSRSAMLFGAGADLTMSEASGAGNGPVPNYSAGGPGM